MHLAIKLLFVVSSSLRGGFVAAAAEVGGGGGIRGEDDASNFAKAGLDVPVSSSILLAADNVAASLAEDVEALAEDEDMESFSMSMSMSMSVPSTDGPDCDALQQMWNEDPASIEASDLGIIKQYCDEGLLSTANEVAEAIDAFELPGNPSIDDQVAAMAHEICNQTFYETNEDFAEVQAACAVDPRDDEEVVDALARLSAKYSPKNEQDDAMLGEICNSIEQNREEINQVLLVLASRSDEQRRRLDDSINPPVTSFEIGSDMISYFDCYCDQSNADNVGCAKKTLLFAQAVANAISQRTRAIGENPEELLKAHSSLEKQTSHLRQSGPLDSSEVYSSMERGMSEIHSGKCDPPGAQVVGSTVSICLYAGPYFQCGASLSVSSSGACVGGSCGAGAAVTLSAGIQYCPPPKNTLSLNLEVCVAVISEVIREIGNLVPQVESFMNRQFNVYGGCLRLAYAEYSIDHQRFYVTAAIPKQYWQNTLFSMEIMGNAWMRFKGDGCAYKDDKTWFEKEVIAYNRDSGFLFGSQGISSDLVTLLYDEHKNSNTCEQKSGPWAYFELTFAFGHDYLHIPGWEFWKSEWRTHHFFKESIRLTATSNDNPSSASVSWLAFKNDLDQSLCLHVVGGRTSDGTDVIIWTCNFDAYGTRQMWYMDSEGYIRSKLNVNKCLDVGDKVNKQAYIWQCSGRLWQQWEVTSDGRIRNKAYTDKYLGVSNGCNGVAEGRRPEPQSISTSGSCARQQQWVRFTPSYRAFYNAANRNLCIDLSGGNTHNGNSVILWDCHDGSNQMFYMDSVGRIRSKVNDKKCLEAGANVDLWAKLIISDCNDQIYQQFELTSAGKLRSKKNGRFIGVSGGCGGVAKGARLEMQSEQTGTDTCAYQQQWY